jgi:hypothetical protein
MLVQKKNTDNTPVQILLNTRHVNQVKDGEVDVVVRHQNVIFFKEVKQVVVVPKHLLPDVSPTQQIHIDAPFRYTHERAHTHTSNKITHTTRTSTWMRVHTKAFQFFDCELKVPPERGDIQNLGAENVMKLSARVRCTVR